MLMPMPKRPLQFIHNTTLPTRFRVAPMLVLMHVSLPTTLRYRQSSTFTMHQA